ncbi:diguanylate cyclase [Leifsonia sp. ZF2019]|uniref:sensor domain-containing diguanylate cyclase n=1 Tax=Leifsonia sp. ZF2019 TaxID=2781978 RepID=UPI001CBACF7D|nr:sensor domain-containing diguanylate cyclase [Leifsonia sp. ZF2019]UAJ79006.1 diguanylate cyclase [Leifsonia sp. ZF2019]
MTAGEDAADPELWEAAPCGLLTADGDGRITRVNTTLASWIGRPAAELVGTPFVELLDPGSRIFYETRQLPTLRLDGAVHEVALTVIASDGARIPGLMNATAVAGPDGSAERIDIALFDVTRREDWERQLLSARRSAEESEARARVLQEASAAFVTSDTEAALAETLAESARSAFAATGAAVHMATGAGFVLTGGAEPADLRTLLDERARADRILVLRVDEEQDRSLAEALEEARVAELTVTPLVEGDSVIGAVTCFYGRARGVDALETGLHEALARQAAQVLRRIRLQAQLEAYALHDPLTGLDNRAALRSSLADALARAAEEHAPVALIFVDLDGFKAINDDFDHTEGDAVLREVASRLGRSIRQGDSVGRFGGDEFLIVCEGIDEPVAEAIAERIREAIRRPLTGIADERSISASIGVAVHRPAGREPLSTSDIVRSADEAMYAAKQAGKDRVNVITV